MKASQANGFSIVSYVGTGANSTIGHGLNSTPDMIIVKNRDRSANWTVWHNALNANQILELSTTAAVQTDNIFWNNTYPTSTVFSVAGPGDNSTNASGEDLIAYCFHDVVGKQKFGTYSGGTNPQTITTGFRPGWLMIKATSGANNWIIYDGSRDPLNPCTASLCADSSAAENGVSTASENLVEFTDNGFTLTTTNALTNASSVDYIYAAFAGSYSDYITDYNTDGSIDSRVKANDTTGFSIVSYTGNDTAGATVGHGLSTAPSLIIHRNRTSAFNWLVVQGNATYTLHLNETSASPTSTGRLYGIGNSVFTLGSHEQVNRSSDTYIAYCWTETTGYSKFGSYTGNGSTTGPTVTCGFKPAMIILKRTDSGGSWTISDNTRDTVNPVTPYLFPHASDAEATDSSNEIDFNSNGFQIKHDTRNNTSGATYIYAAFADTREAAFWLDQSGNDNDWQPVNLDHNDTVADSPTNNFCTMNPLAKFGTPSSFTLADGNLDLTFTSTSGNDSAVGTMGLTSGKWYHEVTLVSHADDSNAGFTTSEALATETATNGAAYYKSIGYHRGDRAIIWGVEPSPTQRFGTLSDGDVLGFALDLDSTPQTLKIYRNGGASPIVDVELPTDKGDTWIPCCGDDGGDAGRFIFNFGQQPFKYDPPA